MRIFTLIFLMFFTANLFATTDMLGRDVDTSNTEKIYFFGPGALRLGTYLGLHAKIVGIDEIDTKSPNLVPYRAFLRHKGILDSAKIIATGGPGKLPSKEAVIKSGATLIVMANFKKDVVEKFASSVKIPVFAINDTLEIGNESQIKFFEKSIKALGEATATTARADALIKFMNEQKAQLLGLNLPQKDVYIGALGFKGAHGIGGSAPYFPPFELLGFKNKFHNPIADNHLTISYEALLKADPTYIFIDIGGKKIVDDEVAKHTILKDLSAFKNNNVFYLQSYNHYASNLENFYINAWKIAKIFGAKVDFEAQKNAILEAFFGESW